MNLAHPNLIVAWLWILLGFLSGTILGLFFHRDDWLGGYGSFKRRMYRLAHISFFGLGAVNLLFWLTTERLPGRETFGSMVSWAFIAGAVTMPLCCVILAHFPKANLFFAAPVLSLLFGGGLLLFTLLRQPAAPTAPAVAVVVPRPAQCSEFGFPLSSFPATARTYPPPAVSTLNPF